MPGTARLPGLSPCGIPPRKGTTVLIRQAITTKFLPVTNTRPSRVKATADAGSVTLSWDHGVNIDENHARAAKALADKFGWRGAWYQGALHDGGFCFVCVDSRFDRDNLPVFAVVAND
jgi:hypothetical protein